MLQATLFDGFVFDALPLFQDGVATTGVDIGRGQVVQALVVAAAISCGLVPIPERAFLSSRFSRVRSATSSFRSLNLPAKVANFAG